MTTDEHRTHVVAWGATAWVWCSCGWRTEGCTTVGEAEARGQAHAAERELERLNR